MSILNILRQDHEQINLLFTKIEESRDVREAIETFKEVYDAILLHGECEERVFYPALENILEVSELLDASYEEHEEVLTMLEQIDAEDCDLDDLKSLLQEVTRSFQKHVDEEEKQLFKIANEFLSKQDLENLGEDLVNAKSDLQEEISLLSQA